MDASDLDRMRPALLEAVAIGEPLPRGLEAAAVADLGVRVRLTVYGGLAVSLYTAGAYVSGGVEAALADHAPQRLREENANLKTELAVAYGRRRATT